MVTRLYLNELGEVTEYSLGIEIIKLVVVKKKQTPILVKSLITKTRSELSDKALQKKVIDLIEKIVVYKLPRISHQELVKMFGLGDFDIKTTRLYEELKQETTLELVIRQLRRRIDNLSPQLSERISQLSIEQLENLAEALLDFSTEGDLIVWLQDNLTQA